MKQIFTFLFALCFAIGLSAQPVYIWGGPGDPNSEFNGGLNDWTTVGVGSSIPDSAKNAVWIWDADGTDAGDPYQGAFSGATTIIESPSVANGVMLFPSDYYDTNGSTTGFGTGPAPSGASSNQQRGELISPVIDCSGHPNVAIQFNQSFRRFASTISTIEVTNDGGATWTSYEVNPFPVINGVNSKSTMLGINTNQASGANSLRVVDISAAAGNQSEVQFKFVFEGGFYYWFVDDVYVIESPASNLMMTHYFYTPGSYATPESQISTDTFVFIAGIKNIGGTDATNVQLKATVTDSDGNIVHTDSVNTGSLEVDSVVIAEIPRTWAPEVPEGSYTITWSARSLDAPDYNTRDNSYSATFLATPSTYSKEPGFTQTNRTAATTPWAIANLYSTGPEMIGGQFLAMSFQTAVNTDDPSGLEGQVASFYLAKIVDFDNFDVQNLDYFNHPNLELVGLSFPDPFTAAQAGQLQTYELYNFEEWNATGEFVPGAPLEANEDYLLIADFPALMEIGFNSALNYFQISTVVVSNGQWFFGGFGPDFSAVLRMDIYFEPVSTNNPQLADNVMQLFPNPANDYFNVDLNFAVPTNATVAVADLTGKVVEMKYVEGAQQEQVTFNGAQFTSGTYMVRVITNEGSLTKRVVIQK